jgi:exosome complex component MTR3
MPRRPARLANCYVPLVLPSKDEDEGDNIHRGRKDRRKNEQLRQIVLETSVIGPALGSSLVELGHTKVLCEVHMVSGGSNNNSSSVTADQPNNMDSAGRFFATVKYAPQIGLNPVSQRAQAVGSLGNTGISMGKLNQQVMQQEQGLSHQLTSALLPVVPLEHYPKCTIVVKATILQDSGSSLSAAITATTLALVDARVELLDLVTSCTVAVVVPQRGDDAATMTDEEGHHHQPLYLVDPTEEETLSAQALICLAMTPNHKEVTLWSQSGKLSASMASQAMNLCREGCRTYHKFLREVWISKMTSATAATTTQ